tara:strand:+ start:198 stop:674 length:477 start_codon:yes stop_codon:yes gene_type:complete
MEVTIRRATSDDIDQIAKLFDDYRVFFQNISDVSAAKEFLSHRLRNSESIIFCAYTADDRHLGFAQLYPSFSSVSLKRVWILNDLFVHKNARGMGIGTKLLNAIEVFSEENQTKAILVETTISNTDAQKLYEANGYQKIPERIFYERQIKTTAQHLKN